MSFGLKFEPAAAREIELAFEWHESRRTGLGAEFLSVIAAAQEILMRDPLQFPMTRALFRWFKLRKFPYGLHYRIRDDEVMIVACLHFRQSPAHWPGI